MTTNNDRIAKVSFANIEFGNVDSLIASVIDGSCGNGPFFAQIRFEKDNYLDISTSAKTLRLDFHDQKKMREIRSRCALLKGKGVPLIRVSPLDATGGSSATVRLDFQFPSSTLDIFGGVLIAIDSEVYGKLGVIDDEQGRGKIDSELILNSGFERFLVRKAPNFLEGNEDSGIVRLLLASRKLLACRLEQIGENRFYLHGTAVEDAADDFIEKGAARRVQFVRLEGDLKIVKLSDISGGSDLRALAMPSSPLLHSWAKYMKLMTDERKRLFRSRAGCELVYEHPEPKGESQFMVKINNWGNPEAKAWTGGDECEEEIQLRADVIVTVFENGKEGEDSFRCTLNSVNFDGNAFITFPTKKLPSERGIIRPAEASTRQDENKGDAIRRLQSGNVGLPVLLDILNDPTLAEPSQRHDLKSGCQQFNPTQIESVERALGNRSIHAIMGPPGTGKTSVIVEIVRRIWKKSMKDSGAPARILLSSTQNEAVRNAVERLEKEGVFIFLRLSQEAQKKLPSYNQEDNSQRLVQEELKKHLNEQVELRRGLEFVHALRDAIRLIQIPSANNAITADNIRNDRLIPLNENPILAEILTTYLGEGKTLTDRLEGLCARRPMEKKIEESCSVILEKLKCYLNAGIPFDSRAFIDDIEVNATVFESQFGAECTIELRDIAKKLGRAIRDESSNAVSLRQMLCNRLNSPCSHEKDFLRWKSEIEQILADLEIWRSRLLTHLQELVSMQCHMKTGVIESWYRSLEENPGLLQELKEKYATTIGATCQKAADYGGKWNSAPEFFDYVIIDEAARSEVFELLIPMTLGKRILLVGDQNQLPPFYERLFLRQAADLAGVPFDWMTSSTLFGEIYESLPAENRVMLDIQYRCHPHIGDAISRAFYKGTLRSGAEIPEGPFYREWLESKTPKWGLVNNHPFVWIDTGVSNDTQEGGSNPRCNSFETKIVGELLMKFQTCFGKPENKESFPKIRVAVIAFYGEQVNDIKEFLSVKFPKSEDWLQVGTVDSFQGKEFPLVILSCSRTDPERGRVGFLVLPNRVNVAVSRAQSQLIVIGSRSTILHPDSNCGSTPFKELVKYAEGNLVFLTPEEI